MSDLNEASSVIRSLSRAERVQLLETMVRDLGGEFPGITSDPEICGGEPCIVRTRIPVWTLVRGRQLGASASDLLRSYPRLRSDDLLHAWAYYELHQDEVDAQIRSHEAA